ncbi:ikaros family zinc finger protein-like isoform X3 [Lethenteron reissneri]|uniref:ikaros family zinc finger protein-like isoform X3 n=1 Tax=Lethenteron reissneri TaxID=7753 RepID=UPI002AB73DB6|nr:ikaros family zinc finger protein-like isoform X3 [Lethenteron reissneri]
MSAFVAVVVYEAGFVSITCLLLDEASCHHHPHGLQLCALTMEVEGTNGHAHLSGSGASSPDKSCLESGMGTHASGPISPRSSPGHAVHGSSVKTEVISSGGEEEEEEEVEGVHAQDELTNGMEDAGCHEDGKPDGYGSMLGCGALDEGSEERGHFGSPGETRRFSSGNGSSKLACDVCGMVCIGPNVLMVHKRSHTGERPFQCSQCGASFTQKGNLLRHIKLHTDEKPFKCHLCSYACRRRDALMGHLRTHSVGKPYKCSHCSRCYKQRSSLEEHLERCPAYQQQLSTRNQEADADIRVHMDQPVADGLLEAGSDRIPLPDQLPGSFLAKRKSSTPQKLFNQKRHNLDLSDIRCEQMVSSDQNEAPHFVEQAMSTYLGVRPLLSQSPSLQPLVLHSSESNRIQPPSPSLAIPNPPNSIEDYAPVIGAVYSHTAGQPSPRSQGSPLPGHGFQSSGRQKGTSEQRLPRDRASLGFHGRATAAVASSPSNSCPDSTDTESSHDERGRRLFQGRANCSAGQSRTGNSSATQDAASTPAREDVPQLQEGGGQPRPPASEGGLAYRVMGPDGEYMRAYNCLHCQVIFLDHVMYTLHMGCHGFRDPFECNVCGHRSRDRYEFSSHIIRGEHIRTIE